METVSVYCCVGVTRGSMVALFKNAGFIVSPQASPHPIVVSSEDGQILVHLIDDAGPSFAIYLDYGSISLVKGMLSQVFDRSDVIIDNDFGTVLPGNSFVQRCQESPDWDWRKDARGGIVIQKLH